MARTGWAGFGVIGFALVAMAGCASAQDGPQNLDAGKTPAQLFASDCALCHKSPQGLAKSGGLFGLTGFLREHYTASKETAAVLSAYLQSFGDAPAAPTRSRQAKRPPKPDKKKPDDSSAAGDGKNADDKKPDDKKADDKKSDDSKKTAGGAASASASGDGAKPKSGAPDGKKPPAAKPADGNSEKKE